MVELVSGCLWGEFVEKSEILKSCESQKFINLINQVNSIKFFVAFFETFCIPSDFPRSVSDETCR